MSGTTAGQVVGGIVGAVVGFYVGGPVGALQGFALGFGVGGYLDPPKGPTVNGPRLSDLSAQSSTYGAFLPRIYGTVGVSGNMLWLENNRLKETMRKSREGGKGGGGETTIRNYSYSATFAVGICEGEIAGVRRIWCGDKLIFDAGTDDIEAIVASNRTASGFTLYLGTDDQLPDPRYEANVGVGNAPAFRGMAYIVFEDFQLADYGNTLQIAQFKFEVVEDKSVIGLRKGPELTLPASPALNESPVYTYISNGVAYWWYDPLDTRPALGEPGNYHYASASVGGRYFQPRFDPYLTYNGPSSTFYAELPIAEVYDLWWTYVDSIAGSPPYIAGTAPVSGQLIVKIEPYPGDDQFRLSCHFNDDGIWVFRRRADNSVYYELRDRDSVIRTGNILQANGTPVTQEFSYGPRTITSSTAYCPEAGGDAIWGISQNVLGTQSIRVFARSGNNYIVDSVLVGESLATNAMNYAAADGILVLVYRSSLRTYIRSDKMGINNVPLAGIIEREVALSSMLTAADVDVSAMLDDVRGYRVLGGSIRSALEPLQGAFPFDVVPSGYRIKCVPRGQSSVETITWESLGATSADSMQDMLASSREMDSQLPVRTHVKYLDAAREYALTEQYSERTSTDAINRVDRELPIVLSADEAAGVAEVLNFLPWLERSEYQFALPPSYRYLEPSDVVTVVTDYASQELRLTEISYGSDGVIECKARPNRAALYSANASGGEAPAPSRPVQLVGDSVFVLLDIPTVDETIQAGAGFVAVMGGLNASWPGGLLTRSFDSGQTWQDVQGFQSGCTFGTVLGTLPASACTLIDQRSITVWMISGQLESITRDQMLAGAHYAAYGNDGRWEIVRFQNATLNANGSYNVSGFVRGEFGTEWASGMHQDGDYFVYLADTDNALILASLDMINLSMPYAAVTSGAYTFSPITQTFAYQGVNLEPLSPVYAKGTRDGSGNLSATFTRRSRFRSNWWSTGVEAQVGEATQSYEIDVMNGSTVVRTIASSTPAFTYSAANQTTDFGSPQSAIVFRIYQISDAVGRGYKLEVSL